MSAIRYIQRDVVFPDIAACGVRYNALLKAYSKKRPHGRKLPVDVELLKWVGRHIHIDANPEMGTETWGGLVISFFFRTRPIGVRNLRGRDIIHGESGKDASAAIYCGMSKTDPDGFGLFRALDETHGDLCTARDPPPPC